MEKEVRHCSIYLCCIDYISWHFTGWSNHCLSSLEENNQGGGNGHCQNFNSDSNYHKEIQLRVNLQDFYILPMTVHPG